MLHVRLIRRESRPPLNRMVGREDDVLKLSAELTASRFVTIVGAGGVGKTTVAVAVAHHLTAAFAGSVLSSSILECQAIQNSQQRLSPPCCDKRILLILDTCEHLVEAIAALAASIMEAAPQVHILATSPMVTFRAICFIHGSSG